MAQIAPRRRGGISEAMTDAAPTPPVMLGTRARGDWVRLRTLVLLRWAAIGGQSAAVLVASRILGFQLPLTACALVISAAVSVNLVVTMMNPPEKRLSERGTLFSLFFDQVQLVTMLMLTGGLNNPFAMLIVATVTISASALRLRSTLLLGASTIAAIPLLFAAHVPLVQADGTVLEVPPLYIWGFSAALTIGVLFLALYARRIAVEGDRMSEALGATQIALAREQRLAAIGGIAAAAAHELGTPLATIKLTAAELASELEDDPEVADLAEDARLIRQEAERCGAIMTDLSRGGRDDAHVRTAPAATVIGEAAAPHAERGKRLVIRIGGRPAEEVREQPILHRRPELIHGLRNLVQNAVDFAASTVWVDVEPDERALRIIVGDDGPGFGTDMLPRLGEPYVSARARGSNAALGAYEGMGLGLFIARTLLERTGARLAFANGSETPGRARTDGAPPERARPSGAVIEIAWPRGAIEASRAEARGPLGRNDRFAEDA